MTATSPAPYVCPACQSTETMHSVTGVGRCFDCGHEWDPTKVHAMPLETAVVINDGLADADGSLEFTASVPLEQIPAPFGMAPADEVFAPLPDPAQTADDAIAGELAEFTAELEADAADVLVNYVGGAVTLEGGQSGVVVAFPDLDHVTVEFKDGTQSDVAFSDVERMYEPVEPDPPGITYDEDPATGDMRPIDPETGEWADELGDLEREAQEALNVSLASLIILAGVAATEGEGEAMTVGAAPVGYLPRDESMFETIERAAALGVAFVMATFGLDPLAVTNAVQAWQGDE